MRFLNVSSLITVVDNVSPDVLPPLLHIFTVTDGSAVKTAQCVQIRAAESAFLSTGQVKSAADTREAGVIVVSAHLVCHFSRLSPFSRGQ